MDNIRHGTAAELWQATIRDACARNACALDEAQESYLVFVLLRHQRDAWLLARIQALDWLEAQAQVGTARADALRDVGDRCLLVAGLFPGLASRRNLEVDYFIDLGRGAYQGIAEHGRSAYEALFARLAATYRDLVATLAAIREAVPALQPRAPMPALAPAVASRRRH
jgi:hypothetical protein